MDSSHLKPLTVEQIDKAKREYFDRDPYRPESRSLRGHAREPVEITKAKTRMRTAAWRCELDKRRRPESATVAIAFLLAALRVECVDKLEDPVMYPAFAAMLADLMQRGYDQREILAVIRRLHTKAGRTSGTSTDSDCGMPGTES